MAAVLSVQCALSAALCTKSRIPLRNEAHICASSPCSVSRDGSKLSKSKLRSVVPISRQAKPRLVKRIHAGMAESDSGYLTDTDEPPPGCSRIKVELGRPLGLVLEEDKSGNIFVAEVSSGGNAEKTGLIGVGDQLIATSAVVYNDSDDYGGVTVRKGMQLVRLNVRGESFNTVMAAIGTHPAYLKVNIELQKCQPVESSS
eukprot:jgi/Mesen1/7733/ME000407S06965